MSLGLNVYDPAVIRQQQDWFEVRSNGSGALLGWIRGIKGEDVEEGELEFNVAGEDLDSLDFVVESEDGVVEITDQPLMAFPVREHVRRYRDKDLQQRPYERETPRYAIRSHDTAWGWVRYTWRALSVSSEQAQLLFDFEEFMPFEVDASRHPETVAGLLLEETFHTMAGAKPKILGTKAQIVVMDEIGRMPAYDEPKGVWTPSYPGRAGSGFQR